jgi:Flp pilus assembly protein TadG
MSKFFPRKFARDDRGNFVMMFAIMLVPTVFIVGMAIDYGSAARVHTKLNAAADSAVLAALTPTMMQQSMTAAQTAAQNIFSAESSNISTIAPGTLSMNIQLSNPAGNLSMRKAVVTYTAQTNNYFAGLLGNTMSISGSSTGEAQGSQATNIDFYLLLDNSPSMALPASQAGINQMISLTSQQDNGNGCAFACHQASTGNSDTQGNPKVNGVQIDNYTLARNNGITLRVDELNSAVTALMSNAQTTVATSTLLIPPVYRFAANAMDTQYTVGFNNLMPLTANYVTGWNSASPNFVLMQMFSNNNICSSTTTQGVVNPCGAGVSNSDADTNYDNALSNANTQMPSPGNGTNTAGDKPQEVLFIITDGVEDENSNGSRIEQQINAPGSTNYCTTIKNRGIQIAVLYTTYLPIPTNSWYENEIAPFQPQISPALQACASPGLFYQASVNENLSSALINLFQEATQQAHLTQ